jgi:hypothetical protein
MQCAGIIKSGTQCSRFITAGSYCWQHEYLNLDLELLIYSYLSLEEILILFHNDINMRDKIMKRFHPQLPNIDDLINDYYPNKYYYTIEYLLQSRIVTKLNNNNLIKILEDGNMRILKLLHKYGIKFNTRMLDYAIYNGLYDEFVFLKSTGVHPNHDSMRTAGEGYRSILEYNHENDEKLPTDNWIAIFEDLRKDGREFNFDIIYMSLEFSDNILLKLAIAYGDIGINNLNNAILNEEYEKVKLLVDSGIMPTSHSLSEAIKTYNIEIINYLVSTGITITPQMRQSAKLRKIVI